MQRSKSRPKGVKLSGKSTVKKTASKKVLKTHMEMEEEARIKRVKQRAREVANGNKGNSRSQSREDSSNTRVGKSQKRLEKELLGRNSRFGGTNSLYSSAQQSLVLQKEQEKRGGIPNPKQKVKQPVLQSRKKAPKPPSPLETPVRTQEESKLPSTISQKHSSEKKKVMESPS